MIYLKTIYLISNKKIIFIIFFRKLKSIGIFNSLVGDIILDLICNIIETEVKNKTAHNFVEYQSSIIEKVIQFINRYKI